MERPLAPADRRAARAAPGDRRGVGPSEPLHRSAFERRTAGRVAAAAPACGAAREDRARRSGARRDDYARLPDCGRPRAESSRGLRRLAVDYRGDLHPRRQRQQIRAAGDHDRHSRDPQRRRSGPAARQRRRAGHRARFSRARLREVLPHSRPRAGRFAARRRRPRAADRAAPGRSAGRTDLDRSAAARGVGNDRVHGPAGGARRARKRRRRARSSGGRRNGDEIRGSQTMATTAMEKSKVLVVDDEPQITRVLRTVLSSQGYQVRTAAEGEAALSNFNEWRPELVITDLYMPHMDGLELCKRIRAMSTVPIIVLSVKGEEKTKVEALDCGADDYVTKPFGIDELLARVRAALRRSGSDADVSSFEAGDFRVDLESRRVHARGTEVRLTPKEFDLFVYMARHPNRVITHRTLLEAVWGEASQEQPEYLRVFMGQLRKKLEPDPSNPRYLVTEPWVGYRFNPNG